MQTIKDHSIVQQAIWGTDRSTWLLYPLCLCLLIAALAGCANPQSASQVQRTSISIDALPEALGRGFPAVSLQDVSNENTGAEKGDLAPNFYLHTTTDEAISLHDLQGRPVMINFWATWCGPCRLEMPEIVAQAEAQDELVILAVNTQEERAQIEPFAAEFEMTMPVVVDEEGLLRKLYQVRGMPTTFFLDREGHIVTVWQGILTPDLLEELLAEIL